MYQIPVRCDDNSAIAFLCVEEGNIDLEHGMRMLVQTQNSEHVILDKKLFRLESEAFTEWTKSENGFDSLVAKIITFMKCQRA